MSIVVILLMKEKKITVAIEEIKPYNVYIIKDNKKMWKNRNVKRRI